MVCTETKTGMITTVITPNADRSRRHSAARPRQLVLSFGLRFSGFDDGRHLGIEGKRTGHRFCCQHFDELRQAALATINGTVQIGGSDYTVERGSLTFANPYRMEPVIDLAARTRRREYDLSLNLSGTPERLNASVASDPPLADLDVLGDVLAGGKTSRLYQRLVYELQIAQNVFAYQGSGELGSSFAIVATARAGHDLDELERVIQEEVDRIKAEPPSAREVQRVLNQIEASRLDGLERIGGFGGKADRLNAYYIYTGNPDYFNEDLARYLALDPSDIQAAAQTWLRDDGRVVLSVVPEGQTELASEGTRPKTD